MPISIPGWHRHRNGTSPPDMRWSPRRAAGSPMRAVARCRSVMPTLASSCRNSLPGTIDQPPGRDSRPALLRQILLQLRPVLARFTQQARGIGREGISGLLATEQIQSAARYQPEPRIAGHGDAARQIDRIVAAELRTVDFGMGDKRGAIALIAETTGGAGLGSLVFLIADLRAGVGVIADRIEALDRKAGVTINHDPLRGSGRGLRSPKRVRQTSPQQGNQGYRRAKCRSWPRPVSFLTSCRHLLRTSSWFGGM